MGKPFRFQDLLAPLGSIGLYVYCESKNREVPFGSLGWNLLGTWKKGIGYTPTIYISCSIYRPIIVAESGLAHKFWTGHKIHAMVCIVDRPAQRRTWFCTFLYIVRKKNAPRQPYGHFFMAFPSCDTHLERIIEIWYSHDQ